MLNDESPPSVRMADFFFSFFVNLFKPPLLCIYELSMNTPVLKRGMTALAQSADCLYSLDSLLFFDISFYCFFRYMTY